MTNEAVTLGRPDRFCISVGWVKDSAPPARRPAGYGWSMGQLTITVAGVNLTASRVGDDGQGYVGWYLGPMLHWLAGNWGPLLHEERFGWPTRDASPAAVACRRALKRWRGAEDDDGRRYYRDAQAWGARHGLRWAAAGGLFPDVFIRRLVDDIEVSWTGEPPPFAPADLGFESGAGVATLSVEDVAGPLWDLLNWSCVNPPDMDETFRHDWDMLCREVEAVRSLTATALEAEAVSRTLLGRVQRSFAEAGRHDLVVAEISPDRPFLDVLPLAVAMYGGLTPTLSDRDIDKLRDTVIAVVGQRESRDLEELVDGRDARILGHVPHEDGLAYASEFLEDLADRFSHQVDRDKINVNEICKDLGIAVEAMKLDTASIRGVALAGTGLGPKIVVNSASPFNATCAGQRFTIAHELCHILFDRSRAKRIAHLSSPWAAPGIEKRANAFAAYLLMPPYLVRRYFPASDDIDRNALRTAASKLEVSESALVEHLFNIGLIDEVQKESLSHQHGKKFRIIHYS